MSVSGSIYYPGGGLGLGRKYVDTSNTFNGITSNVKIYNFALSAAQIQADYNAAAPTPTPTATVSITPSPTPSRTGTPAGASGAANVFPLKGRVAIGGNVTYPTTWSSAYGKYDVAIIGAAYENAANSGVLNRQAFVSTTKNSSTAITGQTLILQYCNMIYQDAGNIAFTPWFNQCNTYNWWLYQLGSGGPFAPSEDSGISIRMINYTTFSGVDNNGLYPYQFAAQYINDEFWDGKYVAANAAASLDGVFLDNCLCNPMLPAPYGDWNRDGVADPDNPNGNNASDPNIAVLRPWLQAGQKQFFDKFKSIKPTKLTTGNIGDYGTYGFGVMNQVLDGGVMESPIGRSSSLETFNSFQTLMNAYTTMMNGLGSKKMLIFAAKVDQINDYAAIRYCVGVCLLNNAYCAVNADKDASGTSLVSYESNITANVWCDEWNINMGAPIDAPQTAARFFSSGNGSGDGVWVRVFTNHIVLVGARRGTGQYTSFDQTTPYPSLALSSLGIGSTFYRLRGTLDTITNNAAAVTAVSMVPRTALILSRTPT